MIRVVENIAMSVIIFISGGNCFSRDGLFRNFSPFDFEIAGFGEAIQKE